MSHLSTKCDCGRTIHFPKDSPKGTKWECKVCGTVWTLSDHGKPAYDTRSKRPPQQEYQRPSSSSNSSTGTGCMLIGFVLFSAFAGGTYKVMEYLMS